MGVAKALLTLTPHCVVRQSLKGIGWKLACVFFFFTGLSLNILKTDSSPLSPEARQSQSLLLL